MSIINGMIAVDDTLIAPMSPIGWNNFVLHRAYIIDPYRIKQ